RMIAAASVPRRTPSRATSREDFCTPGAPGNRGRGRAEQVRSPPSRLGAGRPRHLLGPGVLWVHDGNDVFGGVLLETALTVLGRTVMLLVPARASQTGDEDHGSPARSVAHRSCSAGAFGCRSMGSQCHTSSRPSHGATMRSCSTTWALRWSPSQHGLRPRHDGSPCPCRARGPGRPPGSSSSLTDTGHHRSRAPDHGQPRPDQGRSGKRGSEVGDRHTPATLETAVLNSSDSAPCLSVDPGLTGLAPTPRSKAVLGSFPRTGCFAVRRRRRARSPRERRSWCS
ncbi:MAG: hypothetical protein JWQ07_5458, partial [Ramlibacter sp.]|nr:hypothetical protein [Ramlibacter sp.]